MAAEEATPVLAIIGGGAAGLMAAVALARNGDKPCNVLLFEKQDRVGKKLLASGNGRCNMSNATATKDAYGSSAAFVAPALAHLSPARTVDFFKGLGLLTRTEDDGNIYPYNNQAGAVLDTLRLLTEAAGVALFTSCPVKIIQPRNNGFVLQTPGGTHFAHKVLVAAGGCAAPQLGGTRDGYQLLESLGHHCTRVFPALVQVKTDSPLPKSMKGVKVEATATLLDDGRPLVAECGEVLFTDYGLSGPPIFRLSRAVSLACCDEREPRLEIRLDLMPEYTSAQVLNLLQERTAVLGDLSLDHFLTGMLNKRVGQIVLKAAGLAPLSRLAASLEARELQALTTWIKAMALPVSGTTGWSNAQVAAGGISTKEFDPATLESRLVPGLYAAGEVLDVDGPCGGYNLQWAWSSAHLATCAALAAVR